MSKPLGERIKEKRKSIGASVPIIAGVLEVPEPSLYKWEKGTRPIEPEINTKLEKFIKGDFDTLILAKIGEKKQGNYTPQKRVTQTNFSESVESFLLREKLIASQELTIQTQKDAIFRMGQAIDNLLQQIALIEVYIPPELKKAGAR